MGGGVEIRRCVSVLNMLRYKIIQVSKFVPNKSVMRKPEHPLHTNEYFLQRQKLNDKPYRKKKIIQKGTRINETKPGNWSK